MDTTEATGKLLTPQEMVERTGVSVDTLRYYEREGLLGAVQRASNGHRRYLENDVLWVQVLRCLRETGMSMEDLRRYCELGAAGEATDAARYELLLAHRRVVEQQMRDLEAALELIEHKLAHYPQHHTGRST
ncbi:MAG: MerR family transcriptional regulator [Actinomycetota bacterium]